MNELWFWDRKRPCGTVSHIRTEFRVVRTVFEPSSDEPRVGFFSKSLFSEIVVFLENVFEVGFVPCLWLIWRSKLGRVGFQVNGTLPGRFLVKNSTNGGKGEPLARYDVQQASSCHATAWHNKLWRGDTGVISCFVCLQLRTTITSLSKLRLGCSWTLWKSH